MRRRDFIKGVGAVVATMAAPPVVAAPAAEFIEVSLSSAEFEALLLREISAGMGVPLNLLWGHPVCELVPWQGAERRMTVDRPISEVEPNKPTSNE